MKGWGDGLFSFYLVNLVLSFLFYFGAFIYVFRWQKHIQGAARKMVFIISAIISVYVMKRFSIRLINFMIVFMWKYLGVNLDDFFGRGPIKETFFSILITLFSILVGLYIATRIASLLSVKKPPYAAS